MKSRRRRKKKTKESDKAQADAQANSSSSTPKPIRQRRAQKISQMTTATKTTTIPGKDNPAPRKTGNNDIVITSHHVVSMAPSPKKSITTEKLTKKRFVDIVDDEFSSEESVKDIKFVSTTSKISNSRQGKQHQQSNGESTISMTASRILSCLTPSPIKKTTTTTTAITHNNRKRPLNQPSLRDFVEVKKKFRNTISHEIVTKEQKNPRMSIDFETLDGDLSSASEGNVKEIKIFSSPSTRAKQQQDSRDKKRTMKETKLTQYYPGGKSLSIGVSEKAPRKRSLGTKVVKTNHKISEWLELQNPKENTPNNKRGGRLSSHTSPPSSTSQPTTSSSTPSSSSIFMSSYTALSSLLKGRLGVHNNGNDSDLTTSDDDSLDSSLWQIKNFPSKHK